MKTTLHHYFFNTDNAAEKAAWLKLEKNLKAANIHQMHAHGGTPPAMENRSEPVEIETAHLFNDQWNASGKRVHDWFLQYELNSKNSRRGHWLELTPELLQARAECHKCGYCGHQYGPLHTQPVPADGFCEACLDSPYLKQEELHLLRLVSLAHPWGENRAPLTEAERAAMLPRYVARQTTGNDSRAKAARDAQRASLVKKYKAEKEAVETEYRGMLWLWEKGFNLDNVIYYSHTDKFSFGWRSPVSAEVRSKLLKVMSEFPFSYEIKSAGGTEESIKEAA